MPADEERPSCTIIGGPNGSGKSTIYGRLALRGRFINADNIARRLSPGTPGEAAIAAGRETLADIARALEAKESFVYETTLSSRQSLTLMRNARAMMYEVSLVFVGLRNADLNVKRVAERVARGGHHIPEEVIRRRFVTTLQQLEEAIRIAHRSIFFDNSDSSGPKLLMRLQEGSVALHGLDPANEFHLRISEAVAAALSVPRDAVLSAPRQG